MNIIQPTDREVFIIKQDHWSDPRFFCYCDECGTEIYVGDYYYYVPSSSRRYCEDCVKHFRKEATEEQLEEDLYFEWE